MEGGPAFFSVNQPEHWRKRGVMRNLEHEDGLTVRKGEKYGIVDTLLLDALDGVDGVNAFCVGPLGHFILLSEHGELWTYDRGSRHHERIFVAGHGMFSPNAKLASTGDLLFIADTGTGGEGEADGPTLSALDRASGQLRWSRGGGQIDGVPFFPLAVASDKHYVYVLSTKEPPSDMKPDASGLVPLVILRLTLSGSLETTMTDDRFVAKLAPYAPPESLTRSLFVAVSRKGGIHAFDSRGCVLYVFDAAGHMNARMMLPPLSYAGIGIDSNGDAYIGDSRAIGGESEDDRFILHFGANGELIGRVASFRGKTDGLVVGGSDRMYVWNAENRTITILELQPRTLGADDNDGAPTGVWLSRAFDSAEAETVWHKFTLDADIPDGTQIRVSYFAADTTIKVIQGAIRDVNEWVADESRSFEERLGGLAPHWSPPVVNPQDALFRDARGRYLWLKVEWIGNERSAPTLRRVRVHFPRETLLSHLPAVYRESGEDDFLERFLALFGTLFDGIEERIDGLSASFDRELARGKELRWLAGWLGIECDEHWSDEWVRKLIRAAPELYRYRGTKRGLRTLIETLIGASPIIIEPFEYKAMREHAELRWLTDRLYGDNPYAFTVLLSGGQAVQGKERVLLENLVRDAIPAYTDVQLLWLQPWMYLDLHTYLGYNTLLAEPSLLTIEANRNMPNDTLIVDRDMDRRIDAHTRLGLDAELE